MNTRSIVVAAVLSFCLSGLTYSQSIIKLNPLSLVQGTFSASFEKTLTERRSFLINADYHSERDFTDRYTGIGLNAEYRFYGIIPSLSKPAPEGFFAGPTAGIRLIRYVDITDPEFNESYQVLQVGGVAGYQWLPKSKDGVQRFSVEGSIGLLAGFSVGSDAAGFDEDFGLGSRFNSGIVPVLSISVGYVFGRK